MPLDSVYEKLEEWLTKVIKKEKPSPEIQGYNFGIIETKVGYSLYLMGAKKYDADDSDWACKQDYNPTDMYFDFPKDYAKSKSREDIEENLTEMLKRFTQTEAFKKSFFAKARGITTGFDDGELFIIK